MKPSEAGRHLSCPVRWCTASHTTATPQVVHTAVVGVFVAVVGETVTVGLRSTGGLGAPAHVTVTAGPPPPGVDFGLLPNARVWAGLLATLSPPSGTGLDLTPEQARVWAGALTALCDPAEIASPGWGDEGAGWLAVTLGRAAALLNNEHEGRAL